MVGGESIFVPVNEDDNAGDEDDGYLVTFTTQADGSGTSGK